MSAGRKLIILGNIKLIIIILCFLSLVERKEQIEKAEEKERLQREKEEKEKKEAEENEQKEKSESGEKTMSEKNEAEENAPSDDKPADVKHDDKVGVLEESSLDQVRLPFDLNFCLSANINLSTRNFVSSLFWQTLTIRGNFINEKEIIC